MGLPKSLPGGLDEGIPQHMRLETTAKKKEKGSRCEERRNRVAAAKAMSCYFVPPYTDNEKESPCPLLLRPITQRQCVLQKDPNVEKEVLPRTIPGGTRTSTCDVVRPDAGARVHDRGARIPATSLPPSRTVDTCCCHRRRRVGKTKAAQRVIARRAGLCQARASIMALPAQWRFWHCRGMIFLPEKLGRARSSGEGTPCPILLPERCSGTYSHAHNTW